MFSGERIGMLLCFLAFLLIIIIIAVIPIKKSIYYTQNKGSEKESVINKQTIKKETRRLGIINILILLIVLAFAINVGIKIK
jgi:hypothetical protein